MILWLRESNVADRSWSDTAIPLPEVSDLMLRTENGEEEVVSKHRTSHPEESDELKHNRDMGKLGEWRCPELELLNQELSKLKLDMATVMEEKRIAEGERISSLLKIESCLSSVEVLTGEIEEINEEQVLVELAKIEAVREHEQIEGQRRRDAARYSAAIGETRKKILRMVQQMTGGSGKQQMLEAAMADISMLQNELVGVRGRQEVGTLELDSKMAEDVEAAKKQLAAVTEEKVQYIASVDALRQELDEVPKERARTRKKEENTEMKIQNLTEKLLSANIRLETASAAEAKTTSVLSNLWLSHKQMKSKAEKAEEDCSRINEETKSIQHEIQRIESEVELGGELLQFALRELQEVKSSEAKALDDLEVLSKKAARNRASLHKTAITISKFEYDYLKMRAAEAVVIANEKVAAAKAWVVALKASEKEIQLKTESLRGETKQLRMDNESEDDNELTNTKSAFADELVKWEQRIEPVRNKLRASSKETSRSIKMIPRHTKGKGSTSFAVTRRAKLMPNLGRVFRGKSVLRRLQNTVKTIQ